MQCKWQFQHLQDKSLPYRSSLGRYWYAPRTILVCSASVYRFSWQNTSTQNRPCPAFNSYYMPLTADYTSMESREWIKPLCYTPSVSEGVYIGLDPRGTSHTGIRRRQRHVFTFKCMTRPICVPQRHLCSPQGSQNAKNALKINEKQEKPQKKGYELEA